MSFDAAWLDLREPADHAARDAGLLATAAAWLGDGVAVDLGCGTGSTVRAFGARAPDARWLVIDNDVGLLELAAARCPGVVTAWADLRDIGGLPMTGARLVTGSALFDLVSRRWMADLVDRLAAEGVGFYAALSYDGTMAWAPGRPDDAAVTAAFNAHQLGDKGFGPALGPAAGPALAEALARRGFAVWTAPSPWRLGPGEAALQRALVAGVAAAAGDAGLAGAPAWGQARRAASVAARASIGHCDVLAIPGAPSAQSKITSVSRP